MVSLSQRRIAIGVLVACFVGGAVWAGATGRVSIASIERWLESLGPLAPVLFTGAFVLGSLIGLPGMAFVIGGRLAFGAELGFVLGYGAGLVACTVPFAIARTLRRDGNSAWRPRNRHVARAFALLDRHPLRAVIALRLVLWFNPPLSYALALTPVPWRAYLAGCAIALAPVVAVAVFATGWFL
ncbi:MAG: TVP38/TMEM64 family protein [Kofleriaceae bacterium]